MLARMLILVGALLLFCPSPSLSAIQSRNAPVPKDAVWNPRRSSDDIVLPMPCGFYMAFRTVAVPGGVSRDRRFTMGVNHLGEQREIYERSFQSHIAASFSAADLPRAWIPRLGVKREDGFSYYFLGKYEVSQAQWDAVMEGIRSDGSDGVCPRVITQDSALPVRNVSLHDVQQFMQRYNGWLIRNAQARLPRYSGTNNIGYLRLPTEEEWEYAARGGTAVREEDRENNDTFVSESERPEDYGVFTGDDTPIREQPLPIGSRKGNPLSIFDTMGNVREMIDGFFHVTIAEFDSDNVQHSRLHGSSGGLLCKGGGFRSTGAGVLPGWRDEIPIYTTSGEYRAQDLGFRLVLAGLNLPSAGRLALMHAADVRKEAKKPSRKEEKASKEQPSETALTIDPQGNLLVELDRVMASTNSPVVRENLAQIRSLMVERRGALERQQKDSLEESMRSTLYQAETIRAFAFRYLEIRKILTEEKGAIPTEQQKQAEAHLEQYYQVLLTAANQYRSQLRRIRQIRGPVLEQLIAQLQKEYGGNDPLDRHMQQNCKALEYHLLRIKTQGIDRLTNEQICRDIIPKQHLDQMPHFSGR